MSISLKYGLGGIALKRKTYIILILLIISSVYVFSNTYYSQKGNQQFQELKYSDDLYVKINGEEITSSDVDEQYRNIPEQARKNLTKDKVLESLATEKLLQQETLKKGISTTDDEIDRYLDKMKISAGINETAFTQQLSEQGYTVAEYKNYLKEALAISKMLDQELDLKNVRASDTDVENYLGKNPGFQEVLDVGDAEMDMFLRNKIKMKLTREKQQVLVDGYIEALKKKAQIGGGTG